MCDTNESQLENGKKIIQKSISRIAKKKYSDDLNGMKEFLERVDQNISTSTKVDQVVKDTDLVIEAIVENLKVKQSLFQSLDKVQITLI